MKKYLIIIITLILLSFNGSYSQGCGDITNCDKKYPYLYCKINDTYGNNRLVYYLNCLINKNYYSNTDKAPIKMELPLCLYFDKSSLSCDKCRIGNQTGFSLEVFSKNHIYGDMDYATYSWLCLCNEQLLCSCPEDQNKTAIIEKDKYSDDCHCQITVKFSSDPGDFTSASEGIASAKLEWTDDCKMSCMNYININNTRDFTGSQPSDCYKSKNFIVNDYYLLSNSSYLNEALSHGLLLYNLSEILLHELGHILGLDHYTEKQLDGTDAYICYNNGAISSGVMNVNVRNSKGKKFGLTNDDICYFKGLYCPELTPVFDDHPIENNIP
jgi:hypothetical protein